MLLIKKLSFLILFSFQTNIIGQNIPKDFFLNKSNELLYDIGVGWNSITSLGGVRYQNIIKSNNGNFYPLDHKMIWGIDLHNISNLEFFSFNRYIYDNHFYGYVYSKAYNFVKLHGGPRGQNLNILKLKNPQLEIDLSGFGYQNEWLTLQIGRDRENWSSGKDISLAISENSNPYDYFLLGSNYGKVRVKYIHGFLEKVNTNINRYITARGVEWTNKEYLNISISEIIIYSGENRSVDFGYINPISTHLEVELNERLNILGGSNANAVWQMTVDYYLRKYNLRLSGNYLYDEFVIDKVQKNEGKEHGKAYSLRIAYSPFKLKRYFITFYSSLIHVGTPTFRHGFGFNNFIHKGSPLGWERGSDGEEISFGINIFTPKKLTGKIEYSILKIGEETIRTRFFDQYKDYIKEAFPSGEVYAANYIDLDLEWLANKNTAFKAQLTFLNDLNLKTKERIFLKISFKTSYFPLDFF